MKKFAFNSFIMPKTDTPAQNNTTSSQAIGSRLTSVDALRGLTMFFVIGGEGIFTSLPKIWSNSFTDTLAINMTHAGWEGFYFYDLIFPVFLFLVGLLIPTVISRSIEKGKSKKEIYLHILKRSLVLTFLGMAMYGLLRFDWPNMRWSSVLGRIGICYFFASLLVLNTNWRVQAIIAIAILIAYWAAVKFIPVPGYGAGVLTPEGCITSWVDQKLIPGKLGLGLYDRQGVLSTFPAIASILIGVLAGHWLHSERSGNQKTIGLIIAGIITLVSGWIWGQFFFISRNIWTSSFVLYSSGYCFLLMALFYWIIDVKGYKKWTFFLVVIGMNAIAIWVGQVFIDFEFTSDALFLGVSKYFGIFQPLFLAFCLLMVKWFVLWFMYRKRIFLKA
jgi:predicted acyltransferase